MCALRGRRDQLRRRCEVAEIDGQAIVDQDAHSGGVSEDPILRFFDHRDRLLPANVGEVF